MAISITRKLHYKGGRRHDQMAKSVEKTAGSDGEQNRGSGWTTINCKPETRDQIRSLANEVGCDYDTLLNRLIQNRQEDLSSQ